MLAELRAKFLPRFLETARARVSLALSVAAARGRDLALAQELHAFAGEAAMLGFTELSTQARAGEQAAERWSVAGDPTELTAAARTLRALSRALDEIERQAVPNAAAAAPAPAPPRAPAVTPAAHRVLVVDDSAVGASLICDALADAGIEARAATVGPLEVVLAECAEYRPAIVLVDLQMSHLDAATLAARLRVGAAPRVVLCSGVAEAELAGHAARLGADGHISKSAGPAALVARVRDLLPGEAGA